MPPRLRDVRKPAGFLLVGSLIAAGLIAGASPSRADTQTVTLTPVEDTYVNQGAPSTNFGTSWSLSSRGNPGAISYLRFTLPAAPAGSVLSGAALRVRSGSDASATSVDPHTVALTSAAWNESTITWNSRAAVTGPALGTIAPITSLNTVVTTTLDPSVLAARLGSSVTVTVTSTGADSLYFWSSNHVTESYRPALLLSFEPAPTTTTTTTTTSTTTTQPTTTTTTTAGPAGSPSAPGGVTAAPPDLLTLTTPPRVTLLNQQASSIAGAVHVDPDDTRLRYLGASDFIYGSGYPDSLMYRPSSRYPHAYGSQSAFSVEFTTNASVFEVFFRQRANGMFRLAVDGRRTSARPMATGATTSGGLYLLRFDFGGSATRRITLDLQSVPFGGVNLPSGATLSNPATAPVRWAVLGDSLSGGSDENTGSAEGTWVSRFSLLTGWGDGFNEAIGGTGYVNPGSTATFGARVDDDVIAYRPRQVIVWGGYNDATSSQSSIATAANALLNDLRSGLPSSTVYVVGCWAPTGSPSSALRNTDATLRAAAAAQGVAFISTQTGTVYGPSGAVVAELGPWITGTGTVAAPKGDGNADVYIGSDRTHATDAGHSHIAMKLAAAVAALQGSAPAGSGVRIAWSPSEGGQAPLSYEVHRGTSSGFTPGDSTLVGTTAGTALMVPAHETGTAWYRVVAVDAAGGRSEASAGASATVVDDTAYPVSQTVDLPTSLTVTPVADTYVNQSAPTTNYGASSTLGARGSTGALAYLSFVVPATPTGKTLTSATLTIRTTTETNAGSTDTFAVKLTSASWNEANMTWNTRAAVNGATIGTLAGASGVNTTYAAQLSTSGLPAPGTTVTLVLTSTTTSGDSLYFWSREYATAASRPTLTLSYL